MNMEQVLQTFIDESHEMLQEMEDCLLGIDQCDDRNESINSIFRAAHTIKGSSGLFGLATIVGFTHIVESVLDCVRSGQIDLDERLISLLLECKDYMGLQINSIVDGKVVQNADAANRELALANQLMWYLDNLVADHNQGDAESNKEQQLEKDLKKVAAVYTEEDLLDPLVDVIAHSQTQTDNWHISVQFGEEVLRNGMDPLSILRYLQTLGSIENIVTRFDAMPTVESMDAESSYMGFEINFHSESTKMAIEEAFEFVKDDCQLRIITPHSRITDFIDIIEQSSSENCRLGEILVRCGTITERELQQVLALQNQSANDLNDRKLLGDLLVVDKLADPQVVDAALKSQEKSKKARERNQSVRVDAEKLDALINLIGELVIAGASIETEIRSAGIETLSEAALPAIRLIEEVRDSALKLRMVQIGDTFNRFQRVVRDVSMELGKEIELKISGSETELDKSVIEKITDPITHLVRNSIDHGIESKDARTKSGKSARGQIHLNAFHESGTIVIEVIDDGGGLNGDKILAKAREKGLVADNAELSQQEIFQLIFEAGFSTASEVSNISGRGVGMDVVRRNIEALRGSIEINSELGKGTAIRIRLPLTLAIIDGFMMGVGESAYVVPLNIVEECIELTEQDQLENQGRNVINLRGEVLPFIRLRDLFAESGVRNSRENIVVVRHGTQKAGFVVDRLMGELQTVIKPLGSVFQNLKGFSGSTILGSGDVALILDAPALIQMAAQLRVGHATPFNRTVAH